jgi:peptidylprolyl isomerase
VKAPPASAKKTDSGLAYRLLSSGKPDGPHPKQYDVVIVHYTGWTTDGKMVESTIPNGKPTSFPIGRNTWFSGPGGFRRGVMKGLEEVVQLMKVGDKMRCWIPADLADAIYSPSAGVLGEDAKPLAEDPRGPLVYDIELVDIQR